LLSHTNAILVVTPTRGDFEHTNIDNDIDNDTNIDNKDSDSGYLNSNSGYLNSNGGYLNSDSGHLDSNSDYLNSNYNSDSGKDIDNAFPLTSVPPKGTKFDTSDAGLAIINVYTR
jgi:hypothetical protein